ncbi:MAG: metalloregulator ArsR/SmtB family transcription factor [candidate division FCPU426 bacterium]
MKSGDRARLQAAADLFRHLSDPCRLHLLMLLADRERSVGQLARLLGVTISAVSHQLRQLRTARLVERRRAGQTCFYRLIDAHIEALVKSGLDHVLE